MTNTIETLTHCLSHVNGKSKNISIILEHYFLFNKKSVCYNELCNDIRFCRTF